MEAIILAGGFGTRLSHIVSDVPKPMAPVNGQPFLKYILDYLVKNEVKHVILAVGYKADIIMNFFGHSYQGMEITYSIEYIPLGTGGAIKKALELCKDENIYILNGDTYFNVDLNKMKEFHIKNNSDLTLAVKTMRSFDRYGSVIVEDSKIKRFEEKKPTVQGKINGGTYLINKQILNKFDQESFSFEHIVLEEGNVDIYAFESFGYFIDIGIPLDYYKVQSDFVVSTNTI